MSGTVCLLSRMPLLSREQVSLPRFLLKQQVLDSFLDFNCPGTYSVPVLLFIHGTGVRGESYFRSLDFIAMRANQYLPGYEVRGVQWGDERGAQLNQRGASIPNYDDTGGDATPALASADLARWHPLSRDPLLEIRLQPLEQPIGPNPGQSLWLKTMKLSSDPAVMALLTGWKLDQPFVAWMTAIVESPQWKVVITGITQQQMAEKVARAVTAGFQIWLRETGATGLTGTQRDQLKDAMTNPLGGPAMGLQDYFLDGLASIVTPKARRRRGELADGTSPAVGDILLYQARGGEIRNRLAQAIMDENATVVVAHSLGGVACTDLFIEQKLPVTHFITAGSQAPYFYELNALCSLPYHKETKLPASFPPHWLNLYDPSDFLSFCGEKIFPGRIQDQRVNNGQSFPESHSAYWQNEKDVWPAMAAFLPKV